MDVQNQLTQLSQRITKIEQLMGIQATAFKTSPALPPEAVPDLNIKPNDTLLEPIKVDSTPKVSVGSRALGAVAIFCFVVAGVYFVKLAIESGWLTPYRQFAGLLLLGVGLIASSFQLRSRHGDYSGHLAGAGLAVLYLAIFAGQAVWMLFGIGFAICCISGISALGIFLFRIYSSGYFAAATCIGTYVVPLLLSRWSTWGSSWLYYLLWDFTFTFFAVTWKDRGLITLTSYTAILGGMFLKLDPLQYIIFQSLQFVVFMAATGYFSVKTKEALKSSEAWALVPGILIFYGAEYSTLTHLYPQSVNWFAIGFAAILFCSVQFLRVTLKKEELASDAAIAAVISLILFHAGYLELTPENIKPLLGLMALSAFFILRRNATVSRYGHGYTLLVASIVLVETGKLIFNWEHRDSLVETFILPTAYGISFLTLAVQLKFTEKLSDYRIIPLFLGNSLMLLALSSFKAVGVSEVSLSYLTSALWAGFAVVLLLISGKVGDSLIARSSLAVFGLVGLKILVVDSSTQAMGFRMVMFLIIGVFFYVGGALYGKVVENKS